ELGVAQVGSAERSGRARAAVFRERNRSRGELTRFCRVAQLLRASCFAGLRELPDRRPIGRCRTRNRQLAISRRLTGGRQALRPVSQLLDARAGGVIDRDREIVQPGLAHVVLPPGRHADACGEHSGKDNGRSHRDCVTCIAWPPVWLIARSDKLSPAWVQLSWLSPPVWLTVMALPEPSWSSKAWLLLPD